MLCTEVVPSARRTHSIAMPEWEVGEDVAPLIDVTRCFVVVIDPLGNGGSCSPSNSDKQPGVAFPAYSMLDLAHIEHRLVHEFLGLEHLRAVIGFSMGGMQALNYASLYRQHVAKVISISGTPWLTPSDKVTWLTQLSAIQDSTSWSGGIYANRPIVPALGYAWLSTLTTPAFLNRTLSGEDIERQIAEQARDESQSFDLNDRIYQIKAMLTQHLPQPLMVPALLVANQQDRMLAPQPSRALANDLGATLLWLDSDCGHKAALDCEDDVARAAVAEFLGQR